MKRKTSKQARSLNVVAHGFPKIDGEGLVVGRPAYTDDLAPSTALYVEALFAAPMHLREYSQSMMPKHVRCHGVACVRYAGRTALAFPIRALAKQP